MRVCLSAPYALPLLDPRDRSPIGGVERRAVLIARGLSRGGAEVDLLVEASRRFECETYGGLRVWNTSDGFDRMRYRVAGFWSPASGQPRRWRWPLVWELPLLAAVKGWRKLVPRPDLQPICDRIAPDVLGVFGVSNRSAKVLRLAQGTRRVGVLCLASNDDLDSGYVAGSNQRNAYGDLGSDCAEALAIADLIVAQTDEQLQMLQDRFGRSGVRLPAPLDFEDWDQRTAADSPTLRATGLTRYFVWVGRADRFHKRPLIALEVARRCPEAAFLMVVNRGDPDVWAELQQRKTHNVHLTPQVQADEMPAILSRAEGLISTSSRQYEGAPNVFREAAACGTPVLSLEVPGDLLAEADAGRQFDGDLDGLVEAVRKLHGDDALRAAWGSAGRSHVRERHDLAVVSRRWLDVFQEALERKRAAAGGV